MTQRGCLLPEKVTLPEMKARLGPADGIEDILQVGPKTLEVCSMGKEVDTVSPGDLRQESLNKPFEGGWRFCCGASL